MSGREILPVRAALSIRVAKVCQNPQVPNLRIVSVVRHAPEFIIGVQRLQRIHPTFPCGGGVIPHYAIYTRFNR